MKKPCLCESFDEKEDTFGKSLKVFMVIASSNIINDGSGLRFDHTKIMKCRNCNSYYIWDAHSKEYYSNDSISMKKYSPKTDDDGLKKALGDVNGVVSESEIDWHSGLVEKLREIEFNNINDDFIKN
jgi:hypothetical protein